MAWIFLKRWPKLSELRTASATISLVRPEPSSCMQDLARHYYLSLSLFSEVFETVGQPAPILSVFPVVNYCLIIMLY